MRLWAAIAVSGVASRLDRVAYWLLADRPKTGGRPVGSEHHPAGRRCICGAGDAPPAHHKQGCARRYDPQRGHPTVHLRAVGGSGNPWHPTRYRHSRNQAR